MRSFSEVKNLKGPTDSLEYIQMDNFLRIFKEKLIVWPSRNIIPILSKIGVCTSVII